MQDGLRPASEHFSRVVCPTCMRIGNAYYLLVDLEATCADDGVVPRHQMESIEIGQFQDPEGHLVGVVKTS